MSEVSAIQRPPGQSALAAWKLPPIVAGIAISIVGGFYLGGPGFGMAVGALAAATILVLAARKPPLGPIVAPVANDLCRHVLVVLEAPLQSPVEIRAVVAAAGSGAADIFEPDVLLLAPCAGRRLDRWTSDVGPAREQAQRTLVLSVAALAGAGIAATARAGDENLVQAVEDTLRSFPATEVVLAGGEDPGRYAEDRRVQELRSRLQVPLLVLVGDEPKASGSVIGSRLAPTVIR
jgi:pimeloyl-ACP methyl ester carboxylesterase